MNVLSEVIQKLRENSEMLDSAASDLVTRANLEMPRGDITLTQAWSQLMLLNKYASITILISGQGADKPDVWFELWDGSEFFRAGSLGEAIKKCIASKMLPPGPPTNQLESISHELRDLQPG